MIERLHSTIHYLTV